MAWLIEGNHGRSLRTCKGAKKKEEEREREREPSCAKDGKDGPDVDPDTK